MLRKQLKADLKEALTYHDESRATLLRLVLAAIEDKDAAARADGTDPISDRDIGALLALLLRQRELSQQLHDRHGEWELAKKEKAEIRTIRQYLSGGGSGDNDDRQG